MDQLPLLERNKIYGHWLDEMFVLAVLVWWLW